MIRYACPKCATAMSSPDAMVGQAETCPNCGNVARVPQRPIGRKSQSESAEWRPRVPMVAVLLHYAGWLIAAGGVLSAVLLYRAEVLPGRLAILASLASLPVVLVVAGVGEIIVQLVRLGDAVRKMGGCRAHHASGP